MVPCQLLSLMLVALDIADENDDYSAAKSIMVISQTFYINADARSHGQGDGASDTEDNGVYEPQDQPEYFQRRLKSHRVWQNMRFWESAVFESIGSEMAKINTRDKVEYHQREIDVRLRACEWA